MLERLYKFFTSVKLAVVLLALGLLIVFFGTLAQGFFGLYIIQARYFQSFFIDLQAMFVGFHKFADMIYQGFGYPLAPLDTNAVLSIPRIPIFPGGYLVGGLLLINLFAAHLRYYRPGFKRLGIAMIHLGVVLLLLGQLLTDMLSSESMMHIREGASKNYSEATRAYELAIVDTTDPGYDKVVTIPGHRLQKGGDITSTDLPFVVRGKTYYGNSSLVENPAAGYTQMPVTAGMGADPRAGIWWRELPHVTKMEERDEPSGIVELLTPQTSLGTYLVSGLLKRPQEFAHQGHTYQLALRLTRHYKPFNLSLIEFKFDRYAGTEIPKNYSSRVRLQRPDTGEDREVLIYMNSPLRYAGETFYQADFDKEDEKGTVLQVVHNPSWLTPYFSCVMVAAGMLLQFMTHLVRFASKRKTA